MGLMEVKAETEVVEVVLYGRNIQALTRKLFSERSDGCDYGFSEMVLNDGVHTWIYIQIHISSMAV